MSENGTLTYLSEAKAEQVMKMLAKSEELPEDWEDRLSCVVTDVEWFSNWTVKQIAEQIIRTYLEGGFE